MKMPIFKKLAQEIKVRTIFLAGGNMQKRLFTSWSL